MGRSGRSLCAVWISKLLSVRSRNCLWNLLWMRHAFRAALAVVTLGLRCEHLFSLSFPFHKNLKTWVFSFLFVSLFVYLLPFWTWNPHAPSEIFDPAFANWTPGAGHLIRHIWLNILDNLGNLHNTRASLSRSSHCWVTVGLQCRRLNRATQRYKLAIL